MIKIHLNIYIEITKESINNFQVKRVTKYKYRDAVGVNFYEFEDQKTIQIKKM
jgi:hypothetical protein